MIYNNKIKKLIPYTDQDYDSILESMLDTIPSLTPEYTDYSDGDGGMVLLQESAKAHDILSWKIDVAMNEALPGNSVSRTAVLKQCKWVGYKPKQNTPSKVPVTFRIVNDGYEVIIPKGTQVSTQTDAEGKIVIFETDETIVANAPNGVQVGSSYDVIVNTTQGYTTKEFLGYSSGDANMEFQVTGNPYIEGSMYVISDDGRTSTIYEESETLFEMKDYSKVFILDFESDGTGYVQFGDGINGIIPSTKSAITAYYRIGGGIQGNCKAGSINQVVSSINGRIEKVINNVDAVGGEDTESVEDMQKNAPFTLRTNNRLVTEEDFILFLSTQFPTLGGAIIRENDTLIDTFDIYCLPKNRRDKFISDALKTQILEGINQKCLLGYDYKMKDANFIPINLSLNVQITRLYLNGDMENNIRYEVNNLVESKGFGNGLNIGDVYHIVKGIEGVVKVNILVMDLKGNTSIIDIPVTNPWDILYLDNVNTDLIITVTGGY